MLSSTRVLVLGFIFSFISLTVAAQQKLSKDSVRSERGTSRELDEVVVSASRRPEHLDNIPSSVTVLTRKQLADNLAVTTGMQIVSLAVPACKPMLIMNRGMIYSTFLLAALREAMDNHIRFQRRKDFASCSTLPWAIWEPYLTVRTL